MQVKSNGPVRASSRKRLLFSVLTLLLTVAVLEIIGLLVYRFGLPESERAAIEATLGMRHGDWNDTLRYRPHPYLNYVGNPDWSFDDGRRPHHEIGIRDPGFPLNEKREGVLRVVALGGSTTYGLFVDRVEQVWPHLVGTGLSQTLDREVEVINAALPNYTTREIIGMAAFWLPEFEPDLVLVHAGLNDAFATGFLDEGGPDGRTFRHAWSQRELPETLRRLMRVSRLWRLVGAAFLRDGGYLAGDLTGAIQYSRPPDEELKRNLETADGKYFRRNLETIDVLVRRAGARTVLVDMALNPTHEQGGLGPYYDAVSQAVLRNNRIMEELGRELDIPVVRLYEQMRDPEAFIDAAHVTPKGMMQKAQAVFDAVLPLAESLVEGQDHASLDASLASSDG
jgi:lysophospholipase L1-like esterase